MIFKGSRYEKVPMYQVAGPKGQTVSVLATVSQGSPVPAQTLYAKRL